MHLHEACQVINRNNFEGPDPDAGSTNADSNEGNSLGPDDDENFVGYTLNLTEEQLANLGEEEFAANSEDLVMIKLLDLIGKLGCPLNSFDHIMRWAEDAVQMNYRFPGQAPRRETFVNKLTKRFRMGNQLPQTIKVDLIGGDIPSINVVRFDFKTQLTSLLMNTDLMKSENLDINPDDMFGNAFIPNRRIDDVHSGSWYRDTYKKMITDKGLTDTMLVPIILYMDKTQIDTFKHFSLEPVSMTTTLFKREIRNNSNAWRHLGFLHDFQRSKAESTAFRRAFKNGSIQNVHLQLAKILESFMDAQQNGGLEMHVRIDGQVKYTKVVVPLAFVVGDCQGQDKLCGQYGGKTGVKCLSRVCDVSFEESDDPANRCAKRVKRDMVEVLDEQNPEVLNSWSMHTHDNVFCKLDMGANSHGIWGSTPLDCTHAFRHGLVKYVLEIFYDKLTVDGCCGLDEMVRQLHAKARQSAGKDYPRVTFTHGITSLTYMTHAEKVGILMVLVIILATVEGRQILLDNGNFDNERAVLDWLELFELFLCFDAWTHHGKMWTIGANPQVPADEGLAVESIVKMLKTLSKTADRAEGNGWKISKFHEQLHLPWYITRYGHPMNYDSGRCEHNHKDLCKRPGKTAQMRHNVFDEQVGQRVTQCLVVERGKKVWNLNDDEEPIANNSFRATRYIVYREEEDGEVVEGYYMSKKENQGNIEVQDDICAHLLDTFLGDEETGEIKCFTEFKRNAVLYRSHPNYRSGGLWQDWVYIWFAGPPDDGGNYPCKILCFFEVPNGNGAIQALVQCCHRPEARRESVLTETWSLERHQNRDAYQCVDVESFNQTAYVFPISATQVLVIRPHEQWSDEFASFD